MNHSDDDKLKKFLNANAPVAPERQPDELSRLLRAVDLDEPVVYQKKVWFAFTGAVAASFAAFWLTVQSPNSPIQMVEQTQQVQDEMSFFDDEELPALEVGDDYLGLASVDEI